MATKENKVEQHEKRIKIELYNDHFENAKRYQIPRAQLIIADIPYNIGKNAYGSRCDWYIGGDNKNGESSKANSEFFDTDVAGSGSTLRACAELNRSCYGFEIKKNFYKLAKEKMLTNVTTQLF